MPTFNGLGRALRWLRDRQNKRQYQIADTAGITKAMLSAYETGKQKPSLETLEKILAALECDLNDLHNALQIVNERPEAIRRPGAPREDWQAFRGDSLEQDLDNEAAGLNLYRVLGLHRQLPVLEEQALTEMLQGFHKMVRYLHSLTPQPVIGQVKRNDEPR
ncbi:MAG TPA: helix-turn-helix transcriptional regulator [Thermoanaerobaculia bacterium]|jgi:transcriptional regulator with XRE-family HTH domain|nr:helix-turn-helix transcriptional regulator [Thermoanaerobaculia bacterium]